MILLHHQFEVPSASAEVRSQRASSLLERTTLYREFLAEREEILKHKWFESEKAGCDIGFDQARVSWILHHRSLWRKARRGGSGIPN